MPASNPPPDLSVIWVHYHTPDLLLASVKSVSAEVEALDYRSEFLVVDNGGLPGTVADGLAASCTIIGMPDNPGYAAAVNAGVRRSKAPRIAVMNPDVVVLQGCLAGLLQALV